MASIYAVHWNKRKSLRKKRFQLPQDLFGTTTWLPFHCFGTPIWVLWCHVKMLYNLWFSLAHKHKHKDICTCRMAYLTQFLIPVLLNPMINKMACAILLLICSHEVWVKVAYDWSMALYLCLWAYVDPLVTSQSYNISTSIRRKNLSVWLVLMLMSSFHLLTHVLVF